MAKGFKRKYFSLVAITATVSMVNIQAQAARVATIDDIVVSANKTLQDESDVSDDIEVIDEEEIKERGYQTLKDIFNSIGGASFTSNGGFGQPTSVYLRGLDPKRVVVLIDGVRFNDPTNLNGSAIELINLENVKRVEIIKGSQTGVWGADAIGGVINIVTKEASKKSTANLKIEGGSFDSKRFSLLFAKKLDRFDFSLGFDRFDTGGFSAAEPKQNSKDYKKRGDDLGYEDDPYQNSTINLKFGYKLTNSDKLRANFYYIDSTVHYDNGAGLDAPDGPYTLNKINDRLYNLKYIKALKNHQIEADFKYSNFKRTQFGGYSGSVKEYELKDRFDYNKDSFLQIGGGFQRFYQGLLGGKNLNSDYHNRYFYLTNYNKFFDKKTLLSQSIRRDNYDSFNDKTTYKIGIKQYLYKDIYLSSNYGVGYQVPSIFQLNYNATKELNPEKSRGYDITLGNSFLKATYFYTKIDNLIQYIDPDNNWTTPNDYYYNSPGKSTFKGVETSLTKDIFDTILTNLTYTRFITKDSNGKSLTNRPNWKLGYSLTWYPTLKHTINIDGYYIGKRYDYDGAQTGKYSVTNLTLRHNFAKHFFGEIRVENLFDRFYQEVDGYGSAGRSFYVGINMRY